MQELSPLYPTASGRQPISHDKEPTPDLAKNQDLRIEYGPVGFSAECFELYRNYLQSWHLNSRKPDFWEFQRFLIESPVDTEMVRYYLNDLLVGVSWIDCLPSAISSVYFVFHPEFASRRLGIFSILNEIEYCRKLKIPWLYLGFWVKDSYKMNYKAEYRPAQVLIGSEWKDLPSPSSFDASAFYSSRPLAIK